MQKYGNFRDRANLFCTVLIFSTCNLEEQRGRARSGHPRSDLFAGGLRSGARRAGRGRPCATDVRGMARGGAGAPSHRPPNERSGAKTERGHYTPRRTASDKRAEGRGDGGRGQGARPTRGGNGHDKPPAGAAHTTNGRGEEISARARDARTRWTSGPIKRAEGSVATRSEPPPQVCPLSVARGAGARRHAATADSQGRSVAEPAAGWPA